ncbi:hypothetical protein [Pseudacidovorax intermedius]|uniref:hypothetical protein n=1 Tax=Pseudacidovorax intermedius TaxID=433924 RepID=UPI0026ED88D8|nr:hypothetical protein [Pseudacidovorax intermedius]
MNNDQGQCSAHEIAGTDALVLKITADEAVDARALEQVPLHALAEAAGAVRAVQLVHSGEQPLAYVRLTLPRRRLLRHSDIAPALLAQMSSRCPGMLATVCRLQRLLCVDGPAAGRAPRFHYVVETTPATGWEEEFQRWYDQEHLPGLAQVPGCIRAQRFLNVDGHPASFACYDLEAPDVLGSPAWLAVRGTAWSDRVRPHFTRTIRTMFRVVGE